MDIQFAANTDTGRKRPHNEDNFLVDSQLGLHIVADGMGGHACGEVASAMAVHIVRDIVFRERDLLESTIEQNPTLHIEICALLEYAVHSACEQIYKKAQQEPEKRGMGTTLVALLILRGHGYIAYVGDSRIYLLRSKIVYQLTEDHSLSNELIRQGRLHPDNIDASPFAKMSNAMTRAVGPHERVEVDTLDFDIHAGDAFLLCSDGLYEYLNDEDVIALLPDDDLASVPGNLIDLANTRGGKDNITALVIRAEDADMFAESSVSPFQPPSV